MAHLQIASYNDRRKSPYFTPEHHAFRQSVRRFVEREILPEVDQWDEAETFPRELYRKAGAAGLLGLNFPEEWGGTPADSFYTLIASEELARCGSGGLLASLMSHSIGAPPILHLGSPSLQQKYLPPIIQGELISALAVTEPSGGSDVQNLKTTAVREGDFYRVRGEKTFITSGMRADVYTVAVRTGPQGLGGISLLLVDKGLAGFSQTPLKKMGWWCSDTAHLVFDDVLVPAENLLGVENGGFMGIMRNFNQERLSLIAGCYGFSKLALDEAVNWARERVTFGKPLVKHQVIRHKLADMAMKLESLRNNMEALAWRIDQGDQPIAEICLLKVQATQTFEEIANEAVQIFGGMGYMRGVKVERLYRETKVMSIGGGSAEIMLDLAARQMGL